MGPFIRRSVASKVLQWTTSLPLAFILRSEGPSILNPSFPPVRSSFSAVNEARAEEKRSRLFDLPASEFKPVLRDRICPSNARNLFGATSWHASSGYGFRQAHGFHWGPVLRASSNEPGSSQVPVSPSGNPQAPESDADRLFLASKVQEAEKLVRHAHVSELRGQLAEDSREVLAYSELVDMCILSGAAATSAEAAELCRALHTSATVLILGDYVYLRPKQIADKVLGVLPVVSDDQLAAMETTLRELEDRQRSLDRSARRKALRWMTLGLAGLVTQFALMYHLVYVEYSWDVMEPITFFLGSGNVIIGYIYFLWTRRPLEFNPVYAHALGKHQAKVYRKAGLDPGAIAELRQSIATMKKLPLRKQIGSPVPER